jgi:glycosyltransferase involved in cell wall biosynthesis
MKIFQIIPTLSDGGAERFVVDLCNQLFLHHHEVILCSLFPIESKNQHFKNEILPGIEVISLDKKLGFDLSIIPKLKKQIKKYKPDIVHTHVRALNYLLPVLLITQKKFKVVHTIHNDAKKEISNNKERSLRYWFYKRTLITPVTISKESDRTFKEIYPGISSVMIYNGTRRAKPSSEFDSRKKFIEEARLDNDTKIFIHIGRLEPQKNHLMLLSAFKKLFEGGANALLIMIGGERGEKQSSEIASAVKEACAGNKNIKWLGSRAHATDYLMLGDFFCLSSIYEGMPISLIEAFCAGCVPICTPVGGVPEMLNGNDFLADDMTESAYYEALHKAYACSKEKYTALSNEFKIMFNQKFTIQHCTDNYESLYKQLL